MKTNSRITNWKAAFCLTAMIATFTTPIFAESAAENTPAAAADDLHAAIASGDTKGIEDILDPQVLIFESGGVESSLEEYASHHMNSDMDFMAGMNRKVLGREVFVDDDLAVVTTRSRLTGMFNEEAMDLFSLETLLLNQTEGEWKVRHIHWSSRPAE